MKFKSLEKVTEGKYISQYLLTYETVDQKTKKYEMISRDKNIQNQKDLSSKKPDAVVMIMHDESGKHILLNKEFRLPVGDWVYNFPAGLIDPGELVEVAANRELKEETGLHIDEIEEILPESYSAVGLSNEKTVVLIGKASGTFAPSSSTMEEIEAGWFSKEEVKKLFKENTKFAARTQAYLYLWVKN